MKEFYLLSTVYIGPNGIVVLAASDMKTLARVWAEWAPVPLDTKRVQRITISEGWPTGQGATVLEEAEVWRLREPPPEQHVYECGCITCICGDVDRCGGCGAQSCGQPGHSKDHVAGGKSETVAELKADRDRLRRELDDTKAQLEACEIWRDKLRVEAAKARQSCTKCPNCDRLQRELDEARAQVAKGKP